MTYLSGPLIDMNKVTTELAKAGIPDTVAGIKTTDLLGYGAIAVAGLLTFVLVRKFSKRKRR